MKDGDLLPLKFPPGLFNTGTAYQSKGRWHAGNCVRFFGGAIQPIGGWVQRALTGATITGIPNAAISWQANPQGFVTTTPSYLVIGTTTGLFAIANNTQVYDITPTEPSYTSLSVVTRPRYWQLDVFGSYLMATFNTNPGDGCNLYQWDGDTSHIAVMMGSDLGNIPQSAFGLFVTPERFVVALRGKNPSNMAMPTPPFGQPDSGTPVFGWPYVIRRIFWPTQEGTDDWESTATNTAGTFDVATEGALICGKASRGQSLIWTQTDVWAMQYIGGTLVYAFQRVGNNCGIIGQHAMVVLDTMALWMGTNKFFAYDGFVRTIPCDVNDYVFGNLNTTYAFKVWALANPMFNEVTWFYPSGVNTECDSYVTFNYVENHWSFGTLQRNCGVTQQAGSTAGTPVLIDSTGHVYDHETGNARTGQTVYLESGPIELGDGDQVMRIQRIVPDDKTLGDVSASLYTSLFPDSAETLNGPYTLASPTSVRLTARQVRVRLTEVVAAAWRVGVVRLGAIVGGRR